MLLLVVGSHGYTKSTHLGSLVVLSVHSPCGEISEFGCDRMPLLRRRNCRQRKRPRHLFTVTLRS